MFEARKILGDESDQDCCHCARAPVAQPGLGVVMLEEL